MMEEWRTGRLERPRTGIMKECKDEKTESWLADQAVDIILVTPEEAEKYGKTHCLVIAPAPREGKEVYHA